MQILAGSEQRLKWTGTDFEPDAAGDWVIRSLNYWQIQELLDIDGVAHMRRVLELGLVGVPDSTVEAFIASPVAMLIHPLVKAITAHSRGN